MNCLGNSFNPGFNNIEAYKTFKDQIKKITSIKILDGLDINTSDYKDTSNLMTSSIQYTSSPVSLSNSISNNILNLNLDDQNKFSNNNLNNLDENDLNNLIKQKKKQSSITFSQRALKKADNLTKFNRKNHSEGNKHITNADL